MDMPVQSLQVDLEQMSAAGIEAAKSAMDLNYVELPLLKEMTRIHGKGKPSKNGGHKWMESFKIGEHSTPTARRTGYEKLNLSFSNVLANMNLDIAEIVFPVGISAKEIDENSGPTKAMDLAAERTDLVMNRAMRDFEQHMLVGGVPEWDDFYSLNGIEEPDGFLEAGAPGTQSNIVGGFSKATYASLPGANNQSFDVNNAFNTLGLLGLQTLNTRIRTRSKNTRKGCVIASENCFNNYKRTLQTNEYYQVATGKESLDGVNMNLQVGGQMMQPSTYLGEYTATGSRISAVALDLASLYFMWSKTSHRDGNFKLTKFESIGNGFDVFVAQILVRGQLWAKNFGSSGVLLNAETF
tara:strand:- start:498 stop:1559 length:1062 start_codon:yes stop_codon:yes gene_type:complete